MSDVWECVWEILSENLLRLAESLKEHHPGMHWSAGHSDNTSFPFRAYASFSHDSSSLDDVVASIDFHKSAQTLRYNVDIGHDDGTVLADGPTGIVDVSQGLGSAQGEINDVAAKIIRFLTESQQLISDAMISQSK